jgi:transcriptional regulator with XRE-family HTH domain
MNEFELTLLDTCAKREMNVEDLAERTGYDATLFENIASGRSRQIPVDFFVRIANVLNLSNEEKDALVRSWAFGVERWYEPPPIPFVPVRRKPRVPPGKENGCITDLTLLSRNPVKKAI